MSRAPENEPTAVDDLLKQLSEINDLLFDIRIKGAVVRQQLQDVKGEEPTDDE